MFAIFSDIPRFKQPYSCSFVQSIVTQLLYCSLCAAINVIITLSTVQRVPSSCCSYHCYSFQYTRCWQYHRENGVTTELSAFTMDIRFVHFLRINDQSRFVNMLIDCKRIYLCSDRVLLLFQIPGNTVYMIDLRLIVRVAKLLWSQQLSTEGWE